MNNCSQACSEWYLFRQSTNLKSFPREYGNTRETARREISDFHFLWKNSGDANQTRISTCRPGLFWKGRRFWRKNFRQQIASRGPTSLACRATVIGRDSIMIKSGGGSVSSVLADERVATRSAQQKSVSLSSAWPRAHARNPHCSVNFWWKRILCWFFADPLRKMLSHVVCCSLLLEWSRSILFGLSVTDGDSPRKAATFLFLRFLF